MTMTYDMSQDKLLIIPLGGEC